MKATLKKIVVAAGLLAATCTFADSGEIVNVMGRGTGANRAEALKDAYRDAVEMAVGMYVDAEQQMKNEELVNDQILTQSNAYIEKSEVVRERKKPNGLFEVQIKADVKKSALTKKLRDVMPKQTFALGDGARNTHSKLVTTEKRDADAAALLEDVLKDFNPVKQLMKLSLSCPDPLVRKVGENGNNKVGRDGDEKERIYYRFRFTVDEEKYYNEFLPPLLKVLDQIALKPPKKIRLNAIKPKDYHYDEAVKVKAAYIDGKSDIYPDGRSYSDIYLQSSEVDGGVYVGVLGLSDGKGEGWLFSHKGFSDSSPKRTCLSEYTTKPSDIVTDDAVRVVVITKMNAKRTSIQAREYDLPADCAEAILKCQKGIWGNRNDRDILTTLYNIVFSDGAGEEVTASAVSFKNISVSNVFLGKLRGWKDKGAVWYISPMVHCDAEALERWISFDIPRDDLPNIKSVTVELAE